LLDFLPVEEDIYKKNENITVIINAQSAKADLHVQQNPLPSLHYYMSTTVLYRKKHNIASPSLQCDNSNQGYLTQFSTIDSRNLRTKYHGG